MESRNDFWFRLLRVAGSVLAVGLLIASWYACCGWMMFMTENWGVPWDTTSIRPPIGYWQRTINDFFESGIGMYLPAVLFLTVSLVLYAHTVIRTRALGATSLAFGLSNLTWLVALVVFAILVQRFLVHTPAHLTPVDWSYWGDFRREWPRLLVALILLIGLFLAQPRIACRLAKAAHRCQ